MQLFYTPRSNDDLEIAFNWYERQKEDLGFDFLDSVELSIKKIIDFPFS